MCGSAPSAPNLPQYPGLTPEEQSILGAIGQTTNKIGNVVSGTGQQLQQNQSVLQQLSGLFNPDGSLNQNALSQLSQLSQSSSQAAGAQGQAAFNGIGGTQAALGATQASYVNALNGGAPANQQLQYQQSESFKAMQEQAAQQGINISGTSWDNAVSNSTAGQKLIQNFQQNANIQNQNYQLGYLGQLGTNMGQLAGTAQTQAATGAGLSQYAQQTPLGYLGQSITSGQSALMPLLSNYNSSLYNQYQPYYMQQIGPYQQQMAQQQANYQAGLQQYQGQQGMMGGIGSLAGLGLGLALAPATGGMSMMLPMMTSTAGGAIGRAAA